MKIAMLAGELSGDNLGAGLIQALRRHWPEARFEGIGGERMIAEGLESLFPLERLSVMGLMEVAGRLPQLVAIRRAIYRRWRHDRPMVFIGIDAPDFNLGLERKLRRRGIPTVHYVSPQVWAWRRRRVHKIARSVNLMLTLLPFEADFYRRHQVPVHYVGHPLADAIPLDIDRYQARQALTDGVAVGPLVALLPGSRLSEAHRLGPLLLQTAHWLRQRRADIQFVVPAATAGIRQWLSGLSDRHPPDLPITVLDGQARNALAAADVAVVASGTATLEALLCKCPMVVAYRVAPISAWIAKRMIDVPWYSLPNLLARQGLVRELIQHSATVENLGNEALALLNDAAARARMKSEFDRIHRQLRCNASQQAASAIVQLLSTAVAGPQRLE